MLEISKCMVYWNVVVVSFVVSNISIQTDVVILVIRSALLTFHSQSPVLFCKSQHAILMRCQTKKYFFFLLNWTDKNLPAHGFKCIDRLYVEQPNVHCTLLYVYFALLYDTWYLISGWSYTVILCTIVH